MDENEFAHLIAAFLKGENAPDVTSSAEAVNPAARYKTIIEALLEKQEETAGASPAKVVDRGGPAPLTGCLPEYPGEVADVVGVSSAGASEPAGTSTADELGTEIDLALDLTPAAGLEPAEQSHAENRASENPEDESALAARLTAIAERIARDLGGAHVVIADREGLILVASESSHESAMGVSVESFLKAAAQISDAVGSSTWIGGTFEFNDSHLFVMATIADLVVAVLTPSLGSGLVRWIVRRHLAALADL